MTEEDLHQVLLNHVATAYDKHRVRQTIEDIQEKIMVYLNRIRQGDLQYAALVSLQACLETYRKEFLESKLAKLKTEEKSNGTSIN